MPFNVKKFCNGNNHVREGVVMMKYSLAVPGPTQMTAFLSDTRTQLC